MSADEERAESKAGSPAPDDHPELVPLLDALRAFLVSLPEPERALFVERLQAMIRPEPTPA